MPDSWWLILLVTGEWLLRLVMAGVVLLRRNARSSTSLAWIAVILVVPVFGVLLFLSLGLTRLGRWRIKRHREIVARVENAEVKPPCPEVLLANDLPNAARRLAALAESLGATPAVGGNALDLMGDTDVVIQRMAEDIDAAQDHCHLLFYIYLDDHSGTRIGDALVRAARRGVACRLLVDGLGSRAFLRSPLCARMRAGGVRIAEALPVNAFRILFSRVDLRNHRKIMVTDGRIGYTGSQNIANADFAPKARYAPWVDAMVRVEGPVVRDLQTLFVEDWFLDTDESLEALLGDVPAAVTSETSPGVVTQVYATGPNMPPEVTRTLVQAAMQMAQEELVLTTPYFVPDDALVSTLATGARRGVEVTLIVPARNDSRLVALASRAFYGVLLDSGVRILEFRDGLLHAKTLTVDRDIGIVTSANIDRRSFDINFEAGLLVYDDDFASELRFLQGGYMSQSTPVDRRRWLHRPVRTRLAENSAVLLAPLL
ncbi:MAG: cardiolipin synthase [Phycisphaerales bacterium]|nr:cardiolipin synthase [Phycisphaerales bacterium]